jgi:uncharacterized membrane protein YgcG
VITIQDPGQTLSPAQRDALTAKAHAYPFDIIVEIQTQYAVSRASFEHQVALKVTPGSRIVSIGVDPRQHYTFVRSSAALGVPPGPQVAQAGNAFFKQGNLVDGIDAIAAKANELRVEPVAPRPFAAGPNQKVIPSQTGLPIVIQENHTSAGVLWGVGAFALVAGAIVAYVVWRTRQARQEARKAQEALTAEAAELAARNVEEAGWHEAMARNHRAGQAAPASIRTPKPEPKTAARPVPIRTEPAVSKRHARPSSIRTPAAPSVVVVDNGHSNGLDMLIGYELGRSSAQAAAPAPRPTYEPPASSYESSSSSRSSDSSSSSSWSSSSDSSSSSSYDSGSSGGGDSSSGSDW